MNTLLDITGAILYFILSVVLFPVFLLLEGMLLSVVVYRHGRAASRLFIKRMRRSHYRLPRIDVILKRGWVSILPNRH